MNIAYLIYAHANPEMLFRLLGRLDNEASSFFIHIDKKSDITPFLEAEKYVKGQKIFWLKQQRVTWAGFDQIKTALKSFRTILSENPSVDYVCFISGQHYPLKPVEEFHNFLNRNLGKSFMTYATMPRPNWGVGGMERILYYHFLFRGVRFAWPLVSFLKVKFSIIDPNRYKALRKIVRFLPAAKRFPRKYLKGCVPYEGSNWFTLHADLVKDVLHCVDRDKSFYNYYKYTYCSDEMFFQSLILNKLPEYKDRIVNDILTFIDWDESTGRPYTLDERYLDELKKSKDFLARKFCPTQSSRLLDELDSISKLPIHPNPKTQK